MYAIQAKDCFGCVNLKRKQHCILNKQYTKEEYEKLRAIIIKDMKNNPYTDKEGRVWKYGEQLPFAMSPFAYNETMANYYFPLTKEEAREKNMSWYDIPETDHTITIKADEISNSVQTIDESIKNEIIECVECQKGYKISDLEIYLHKKIEVPFPHKCWKCRFKRRFGTVNMPYIHERTCAKCSISITTSYASDRPEIIYCEKCYQQEFV